LNPYDVYEQKSSGKRASAGGLGEYRVINKNGRQNHQILEKSHILAINIEIKT